MVDAMLRDFFSVARKVGVSISTSEAIDAVKAVELVGFGDRDTLRDALLVSLAKTFSEKAQLAECFDRFFSLRAIPLSNSVRKERSAKLFRERIKGDVPLTWALITGDVAGLFSALGAAADQENISGMRSSIQLNLFTWRILNRMGISELDAQIRELCEQGDTSALELAAILQDLRDQFVKGVRDYVRRRFESSWDLEEFRKGEELRLRRVSLSAVEEKDYEKMQFLIQRIVKRLNDLYSRRRKRARRGVLDFKRTLRKNVTYQGFLFVPMWKKRKIDRPDVVTICDVSRSVIRYVRFLLLFLYGLSKEIVRIRSFVFCTNLVEVTELFERYSVAEAIERIQNVIDIPLIMGRTDYERAFGEFCRHYLDAVNHRTTVLVLGDARNNYTDPHPENLRAIYEKCHRLIWLNPEIPSLWGSGDSEMHRFAPFCTKVLECNTVDHIDRIVSVILRR
ncbi:MAG: VWA domain-containing protein [Syntrophales bacterium]|nr:VWA domain-containing protein [Syntrophales bacterium]